MTEQEYPEAWGVLKTEANLSWWKYLRDSKPPVGAGCQLIRLLPHPVVDRMIREAVDAERERCRMLCVRRYYDYRPISPQFDNENYRANRDCAEALEVAIESGREREGD